MNSILTLGARVLRQLAGDKWFLFFSLAAPVAIIIVLKVFFGTFPDQFPVQNYIVGIAATVVFIITFVLSMISVVEERVNGTLQRMFVNGVSRSAIITGYVLGYLAIATIQAAIVVFLTLRLFNLSFAANELLWLFAAIWLLAVASVALGLFISSFVRRQVQIIPFIPIVMLPSVFLSGIIVNIQDLPRPAQIIGQATPLHYANNIVAQVVDGSLTNAAAISEVTALAVIIIIIIFLASQTLRPVE